MGQLGGPEKFHRRKYHLISQLEPGESIKPHLSSHHVQPILPNSDNNGSIVWPNLGSRCRVLCWGARRRKRLMSRRFGRSFNLYYKQGIRVRDIRWTCFDGSCLMGIRMCRSGFPRRKNKIIYLNLLQLIFLRSMLKLRTLWSGCWLLQKVENFVMSITSVIMDLLWFQIWKFDSISS